MTPLVKLIAIVLPEPVYTEVREQQLFIAKTWGPKHALRTPPHITIIPPMALKQEEVPLIFSMASALSLSFSSFTMQLNGYGAFKPRVVFVHPQKCEALDGLEATWEHAIKQKLPHALANYPDRPYHPHVTLAHKDVRREQFEKIWDHYSALDYRVNFEVKEFCVLDHTKDGWAVERRFSLQ
jgi:2'-5' RNA ligase